MDELISIIVPVYNVEKYIDRCIKSLLSQRYTNIEIILVDDGSTDNSGKICDVYSKYDNRVKVVHKKNGGQASARNAGLDLMLGKYVAFVDSDDFISESYIAILYSLMKKYSADISICGFSKVYESKNCYDIPQSDCSNFPVREYSYKEAIYSVFYQKKLDCSLWGKLYRSSLFKNIRLPNGLLYEDLAIIYPLLLSSNRLIKTDCPLYFYVIRKDSTLGIFNRKRTDVLNILDSLEDKLILEKSVYLSAVRSRNLSAHFNILGLVARFNGKYTDIENRCWNYIKSRRLVCLVDRNIRLKNIIGILVSFLGIKILKTVEKMIVMR